MGRAMVARLGLGLLLLALLLPTQIYSNQTFVETPINSAQNTSAAPNPTNATTKAGGHTLQSTAGLFPGLPFSSTSLLLETQAKECLYFLSSKPTPNGNYKSNVARKKQVCIKSMTTPYYCIETENAENS